MTDDLDRIHPDPCALLGRWLATAESSGGMTNWNTMYLATVDEHGRPSVRAVLNKGYDPATGAIVFYTNYESPKAEQIDRRGEVSAVMHWDALERQVRIWGRAEQIDDERSDAYFASRPRLHQIGAWASRQSRPLDAQRRLRARAAATVLKYAGRTIPRPPHWGGYEILPRAIEFWRAMPGRIHRRVLYERLETPEPQWTGRWLYP